MIKKVEEYSKLTLSDNQVNLPKVYHKIPNLQKQEGPNEAHSQM